MSGARFWRQERHDKLRIAQRRRSKGHNVMHATTSIEEAEEILGWDVSDEALEIAGTAGQVIAGGYTLQFCTSRDCALVS